MMKNIRKIILAVLALLGLLPHKETKRIIHEHIYRPTTPYTPYLPGTYRPADKEVGDIVTSDRDERIVEGIPVSYDDFPSYSPYNGITNGKVSDITQFPIESLKNVESDRAISDGLYYPIKPKGDTSDGRWNTQPMKPVKPGKVSTIVTPETQKVIDSKVIDSEKQTMQEPSEFQPSYSEVPVRKSDIKIDNNEFKDTSIKHDYEGPRMILPSYGAPVLREPIEPVPFDWSEIDPYRESFYVPSTASYQQPVQQQPDSGKQRPPSSKDVAQRPTLPPSSPKPVIERFDTKPVPPSIGDAYYIQPKPVLPSGPTRIPIRKPEKPQSIPEATVVPGEKQIVNLTGDAQQVMYVIPGTNILLPKSEINNLKPVILDLNVLPPLLRKQLASIPASIIQGSGMMALVDKPQAGIFRALVNDKMLDAIKKVAEQNRLAVTTYTDTTKDKTIWIFGNQNKVLGLAETEETKSIKDISTSVIPKIVQEKILKDEDIKRQSINKLIEEMIQLAQKYEVKGITPTAVSIQPSEQIKGIAPEVVPDIKTMKHEIKDLPQQLVPVQQPIRHQEIIEPSGDVVQQDIVPVQPEQLIPLVIDLDGLPLVLRKEFVKLEPGVALMQGDELFGFVSKTTTDKGLQRLQALVNKEMLTIIGRIAQQYKIPIAAYTDTRTNKTIWILGEQNKTLELPEAQVLPAIEYEDMPVPGKPAIALQENIELLMNDLNQLGQEYVDILRELKLSPEMLALEEPEYTQQETKEELFQEPVTEQEKKRIEKERMDALIEKMVKQEKARLEKIKTPSEELFSPKTKTGFTFSSEIEKRVEAIKRQQELKVPIQETIFTGSGSARKPLHVYNITARHNIPGSRILNIKINKVIYPRITPATRGFKIPRAVRGIIR